MNALKRWNKLKGLESFRHNLDSLLRHLPVQLPEHRETSMAVAEWSWPLTNEPGSRSNKFSKPLTNRNKNV
jgi:hypothetical protein